MGDCCKQGHYHTGTPREQITKWGGVNAYITSPKANAAASDADVKKVIFFVCDVHGIDLVNNRLLCDRLADGVGAKVYAPDFFNEESLGKVAPTPELREKVNLQEFLGKYHPREWAWERASKWISEIRKAHPNAKVGTVGFCWGAPTTLKAADKNTPKEQSADALAFAHGSLVQVTDFDNVSKPGLYITPEHDAIFTEEIRLGGIEKTKQLAKENGVYSRWSYYPLVSHGFAVRGDEGDAYQSRAMRDAVEELVIHFKHSLE